MTAPTPDLVAIKSRSDAATSAPWTPGDTNPQAVVARNVNKHGQHRVIGNWGTHVDAEFVAHAREDIPALLAALAAVTAERDQVVCELAEQKRINASNLRVMVKEADQVQGQLDQARQILADAPHELDCSTLTHGGNCDCWKAGL